MLQAEVEERQERLYLWAEEEHQEQEAEEGHREQVVAEALRAWEAEMGCGASEEREGHCGQGPRATGAQGERWARRARRALGAQGERQDLRALVAGGREWREQVQRERQMGWRPWWPQPRCP